MSSENGYRVGVTLDTPLYKSFKKKLIDEERELSEVLRELIEYYLKS